MFTANFSPQKENGTIASWPLFLFSPVLEQATVGIFNMNMRSMRPAARIACNPCAGAEERIDERQLVWKRRLWLVFLYSNFQDHDAAGKFWLDTLWRPRGAERKSHLATTSSTGLRRFEVNRNAHDDDVYWLT